MWQRSQLLHPATIIATIALFVSLGGVTYAAATIGTKQLKTGAVTRAKIKNRAVSASKLANNAVVTEKLATGAVTPTKLRTGAVTAGKIADGAIQTSNLQNGAVTDSKLGSGAVSETKIGAGAVTSGKLAAGAVGGAAIADGAVTLGKIAPNTVISGRGAVTSFHRQLTNGQTISVATIPGFGKLSATCTSGDATSTYANDSGSTVTVHKTSMRNGVAPVVSTVWLGSGNSNTVANAGGDQTVTWQLGYTDAASTDHVATIEVSNIFDGTGCYVIAQVQSTG